MGIRIRDLLTLDPGWKTLAHADLEAVLLGRPRRNQGPHRGRLRRAHQLGHRDGINLKI